MSTLEDVTKAVIEALKILGKEDINPSDDAVLLAISIIYTELTKIDTEFFKDGGYYV